MPRETCKARMNRAHRRTCYFTRLTHRIRFRNYIPRDDALKEKMDNVVVNEKPLDYEADLKASTAMPGVVTLTYNHF